MRQTLLLLLCVYQIACSVVALEAPQFASTPLDQVDPIYMAGDTIRLAVVGNSSRNEITLQYAADGVNFADVAQYSGKIETIPWTIPQHSTPAAKLKIIVSDPGGRKQETTSPPFKVYSRIELFSGKKALNGSNDGTALTARFKTIEAVVKIGSSLYVADAETIRKVDMTTPGQFSVTTFAGKAGAQGTADGVGEAARFKAVRGLATDGVDLYATDTNHTIRKIEVSTRMVSTLAGQPGVSGNADGTGAMATLNSPFAITHMGGLLYFTDQGNHRIRSVSLTGVVTTVAGSTSGMVNHATNLLSARFNSPLGITGDGTSLYIADSNNHMIRKANLSTGETTTLAGKQGTYGWGNKIGAEASFSSPRHIAYGTGYVYVSDYNSHSVRRIDVSTGAVTTFLGSPGVGTDADGIGTNAKFNSPSGITISAADEMYFASLGNAKIYKVVISTATSSSLVGPSTADVLTVRSAPVARLNPLFGLMKIGNDLYFSEANSHTIRRLNLTTKSISSFAGVAGSAGSADGVLATSEFNQPRAMVKVGTDIYVADSLNHSIRRIDSSGNVTTLAGLSGTSGNVPAAGTTEAGATARFNTPIDILAIGSILYVADHGNHKIRRIDVTDPLNPTVSTYAGSVAGSVDATGTAARLRNPHGIATDGTDLYVSDNGNHILRKISLPPNPVGVVTTVAGTSGTAGLADDIGTAALLRNPKYIVANATDVYFADNTHRIRKYTISTGAVTTTFSGSGGHFDGIGTQMRFNNVQGLVLDGTDLYVANHTSMVIQKVNLTNLSSTTLAGVTNSYGMIDGVAAEYSMTYNSVLSSGDSLYLGGWETHAISKILADGSITPFFGEYRVPGHTDGPISSALLYNVVGMAQVGREIYFSNGSTIRKINLDSNIVTTVAGTAGVYGSADGLGVAASFGGIDTFDTDGTYLYINDRPNHLIRRMNLATREVVTIAGQAGVSGTTDGGLGVGTLNSPTKIMYFNGSVYVTDNGNHVIRQIENAQTSNPVIKTIVGQVGVAGYSETGVGTFALIDSPVGIANDGKYVYFLNAGTYVLQRFDPVSLQIKTIAGKAYQSGMIDGNIQSGRLLESGHAITMSPFGILIGGGSSLVRVY